jgi:hypothetical protein
MKIDSLMDLTIEDYLMITSLSGQSESFITKELVKYFNLGELSISEVDDFMDNLNNILKSDAKFIQRFELDGIEYGFIPNLDIITAAEWIDIDNYQKEDKDIHRLLSILYRPIVKKFNLFGLLKKELYNIQSYNGTTEKLRKAPLEVYLGAMVFFYLLSKKLLVGSSIYTQNNLIQMIKEDKTLTIPQKISSLKNLDGII